MDLAKALLELLKAKTAKGRLNKAIDLLLHPHFPNKPYVIADTYLHYLAERDNPKEFLRKFLRYNLKYLLQEKGEARTKKTRRRRILHR